MAFISRKSLTIKDLRRGGRLHRQVIYIQKDTKINDLAAKPERKWKIVPHFWKKPDQSDFYIAVGVLISFSPIYNTYYSIYKNNNKSFISFLIRIPYPFYKNTKEAYVTIYFKLKKSGGLFSFKSLFVYRYYHIV